MLVFVVYEFTAKMIPHKGWGRYSTSHKVNDDAHNYQRTPMGVAVHCGRGGHPGTVAIEFSGETGSDDQFAHEQAPPSTSQSSRSNASHIRGHRMIDEMTGLTPVTFRVPGEVSHQFGLSWHQFVTGGTVENSIPDGNG